MLCRHTTRRFISVPISCLFPLRNSNYLESNLALRAAPVMMHLS